MKPQKVINNQDNLFRNRLSNQLNPRNELFQLAKIIPWDEIDTECSSLFSDNKCGRPPAPVRLVIGLLLLQYMHNLSDENVVRTWAENPYWQYFCGYDLLQWELPIDSSSLTRWRKRLGPEKLQKILAMTVSVSLKVGVIKEKDLENVIADTTVMPKNIEYPTDVKLLEKARCKMVKLCEEAGLTLRQNYNLVTKGMLRKIGSYLHVRQMKRAAREIKHFKTLVGRVMRDCSRKLELRSDLGEKFAEILSQTKHLLERKKSDGNKLYSLHEPEVVCISKGKAQKKYEFGCKISLVITHRKGSGIILSSEALVGNPFDGHSLKPALENTFAITGVKVKNAFVDKGYKGHGIEDCNVFISGQKRGMTVSLKKAIKRRQSIEPYIGHLKEEVKLGLSRLKSFVGDRINALLAAASYNLKQVLRYLRNFLSHIFAILFIQIIFAK
jgi:IS5 family transposase